ncbi:MAG TPA: hypothetical protein VLG66_02640 [Alphaproteobacteria bacterium]|jgi:hypothetical protein|nr:hypothetical protein [Alphaproteobacteria bacterium]
MVRAKIPGFEALTEEARRIRAAANKVPEWKTIMDAESKQRDALAAKQRAARLAHETKAAAERANKPATAPAKRRPARAKK